MNLPIPLGTQVSELVKAVKACKSVYDAFFDQYDNAPARLRELGALISTFEDILQQNYDTLKRQNTTYPGHGGLEQTLKECSTFLQNYKYLCDQKSHGAKKIVFTAIYALDQNHVARLDRQLMRHALPMLLWNSNSLLKWAFDRGEEPPVIQQPDLPLSKLPEESDVEEDGIQEAEAARTELDRFRREMMELQAKMPRPLQRQERRTMFFQEFHGIVSRHWMNLGLPGDELLEIFSSSDASDELSSLDASPSLLSSTSTSRAEMNRCKVTIILDKHGHLESSGYRVEEDQHMESRVILWYDQQNRQLMKHHVPFGSHPHTYHTKYLNRHRVSFLQEHKISLGGDHYLSEPIYDFAKDPDCKAFQRFVRNRELLGTFDAHLIKCETGKLAQLQQIKVWRLDGADAQPTISFFADRLDYDKGDMGSTPATFCELHLRWFESMPRHESPKVLRLVLNKLPLDSEPQSPRRRLSFIGRRRSSSTSPTSSRPSVSINYADPLYDTINTPLITNTELYMEMNYVEIEFSNSADVQRFIRTSRNAHPRASFGSQSSILLEETSAFLMTGALPSQSIQSVQPGLSAAFTSTGSPHSRPPSSSSGNARVSPTMPIQTSSPAAASVSSHRSNSTSMPPTPALTERSVSTSHTGATTPNLQIPSLPEVKMPPGFYQWEF